MNSIYVCVYVSTARVSRLLPYVNPYMCLVCECVSLVWVCCDIRLSIVTLCHSSHSLTASARRAGAHRHIRPSVLRPPSLRLRRPCSDVSAGAAVQRARQHTHNSKIGAKGKPNITDFYLRTRITQIIPLLDHTQTTPVRIVACEWRMRCCIPLWRSPPGATRRHRLSCRQHRTAAPGTMTTALPMGCSSLAARGLRAPRPCWRPRRRSRRRPRPSPSCRACGC